MLNDCFVCQSIWGIITRMELRHLRYFIGVAEEENVSRAALKFHVSQPTLTLMNENSFLARSPG